MLVSNCELISMMISLVSMSFDCCVVVVHVNKVIEVVVVRRSSMSCN